MKSNRFSSMLTRSAIALALVATASVAYAGTYTYSAVIPTSTGTDYSLPLSIPTFNAANNVAFANQTLNSVDISFFGTGASDIIITNNSGTDSQIYTLGTVSHITISGPGLTPVPPIIGNLTLSGSPTFVSPTTVAAGGGIFNSGAFSVSGTTTVPEISTGLAAFTGPGSLAYNASTLTIITDAITGGNAGLSQTTTAGVTLDVTYNYSAAFAPEPSSLGLFGTGLVGLAGMLRRKFLMGR